jgi:peptide deformylase
LAQAVSIFKLSSMQTALAAPIARARSVVHAKESAKQMLRKARSKPGIAVAAPQPKRVAIAQTAAGDEWEQF